jgi:hypothetical protein
MHRLTPTLVIDADPRGLEALAYGFQGEGWLPTITPNYADAPDAAAESASQLAVVVVRDPAGPALAALRSLREGSAPSLLPVLVLGPESIRQEIRALPGVDFLPLPAFVRDVLTASRLLTATYQTSGHTDDESGLSGSLSEYGLFFLVRTMIGLGRSGILQIERANRRGEIRFSDGEVTGATVGSLQGTAALHQLLLWEEAALDLKLRTTVHRGAFNQRPDDLIEEAERFLRDFAHASKDLGPIATVLHADPDRVTAAGDSLPAEVGPLVRLLDGQRTLGEVLEDSPFRVFDTLRIVSRLADLGVFGEGDRASSAVKPSVTPTIKIMAELTPGPLVPQSAGQAGEPGRPGPALASGVKSTVPPKDQRNGPSNRRKLQRRERGTLEQRTLNRTPPLDTTAPIGSSTPSPDPIFAAPTVETPPLESTLAAADPAKPAAGELRASGILGAARGELRSVGRDRPKAAESPSVVIDMAASEAVTAPVQAPAATTPSAPTMQAVGVMQARRSPLPPRPNAPSGFSIEVDPALMAELAAHEASLMPATPAPAQLPVAGKINNGKSSGPTPPAAPAAPAAAAAAPPQVEPGRPARRPSSEFNALESDFFAREADLYKHEHPETFDDLEHGGARPDRPNRSR